MENNKSVVILYSGGLDSFVMHKLALSKNLTPICVFFDIGQPYLEKELSCLPSFVKVRKVDWLLSEADLRSKDNKSGNIYIPGRNLTLACLAASIYNPSEIWLGALLGEIHDLATDKNLEFVEKTNAVLKYVFSPFTNSIELRFPLVEAGFSKLTEVKWALDNGATVDELHHTSSCLSAEPGNCGTCVVCSRRWGIFGQLGIPEKYNTVPFSSRESLQLFIELLNPDSYYDSYRREEIIPYLKQLYPCLELSEISSELKKRLDLLL